MERECKWDWGWDGNERNSRRDFDLKTSEMGQGFWRQFTSKCKLARGAGGMHTQMG
jgi:hypothetical protein